MSDVISSFFQTNYTDEANTGRRNCTSKAISAGFDIATELTVKFNVFTYMVEQKLENVADSSTVKEPEIDLATCLLNDTCVGFMQI